MPDPERDVPPAQGQPQVAAAWNRDDVVAIQRQLARLGLYRLPIDGDLGPGSRAALVEAFVDDNAWRALPAADVLARLGTATPPAGARGEHRFRVGEMARDGVLDVTVGVGFDEGNAHTGVLADISNQLHAAGFVDDRAAAAELYRRTARTAPLAPGDTGRFFVRRGALTVKPPAGTPRSVDAVLRLVANSDGNQGAAAAAGFRDGMAWSDVIYYCGHARYGSGPDFDRNMTFELAAPDGSFSPIDDYETLEKRLGDGGHDAWKQFLALTAAGKLRVHGWNQGNVFLNPVDQHSEEFGGRLMYWNLARSQPDGAPPITGAKGPLAHDPDGRYRLWIFDGCRTQDYVSPIRATPGHDPRSADIVYTRRLTYWNDKSACFRAFLTAFLDGATCEQLVARMDATHVTLRPTGADAPALRGDGIDDDPIIP